MRTKTKWREALRPRRQCRNLDKRTSKLAQQLSKDPQKELVFGYHRIGIVTVLISSLVSNVVATAMIAYKTWYVNAKLPESPKG